MQSDMFPCARTMLISYAPLPGSMTPEDEYFPAAQSVHTLLEICPAFIAVFLSSFDQKMNTFPQRSRCTSFVQQMNTSPQRSRHKSLLPSTLEISLSCILGTVLGPLMAVLGLLHMIHTPSRPIYS